MLVEVRADTDDLETHPQEEFAARVRELEVAGVVGIERIYFAFEQEIPKTGAEVVRKAIESGNSRVQDFAFKIVDVCLLR